MHLHSNNSGFINAPSVLPQKRRDRTSSQDVHARAQVCQCAAEKRRPARARSCSRPLLRDRRRRQPQAAISSTRTAYTLRLTWEQLGPRRNAQPQQTVAFQSSRVHGDTRTHDHSRTGVDVRRPVPVS